MAQSPGVAIRRPASAAVLDYAIPAAILLAVLVVLAPVPPAIVDLLLAANLTVSVLALLGALAARTPLEMSVFPTFLLGATLVRLVLNIATTRLILSRAAIDGPAAAGHVVEAFGEFVAANNLVVGAVVFGIIAVVQFVVITAGSTRTSEVAARFALDGLPGRQMAIDAEVQAGSLSREEGRRARLDLQRHADFFASMDGASRFVAGEAKAGVIITLVNLVGGLALGVVEHGMPLAKALDVYARLTIGDGLTSAVPALFVSVATGLLISRSSQAVDLSREFGRQFTARPQVLAVTGVFLGLLSLTDLPFLPLATMAGLALGGAYLTSRRRANAGLDEDGRAEPAPTVPLADVIADEQLVVRLGGGLVGLITGPQPPLLGLTASLRTAVAADLGVVVPQVSFRDDPSLPARGYAIQVAGELVHEGDLPAGRLLVIADADGQDAVDPLTGRRAAWAAHAAAETARLRGATVLDEPACIARALEAVVRRHADRLLSRDAANRLVESLRVTQPALVEQVVPGVLSIARIQRTLQCLLQEGVPARPLAEIIEIMSDHAAEAAEPRHLAEIVRRRLAGSIRRRARDPEGRLTAVRLAGGAVEPLVDAAARPPARLVAEIRRATRPAVERGGAAVLVVPGAARRGIRDALARSLPDLLVLAEEEVADEDRLEIFATVGAEEAARAA
ncbi:MAG: FHIPEP family type III secretion protein [Planctomycetia bacterium]